MKPVITGLIVFCCIYRFAPAMHAQPNAKRSGFIEFNTVAQNNFGMSDRPAELTYGIDSSSYDYKRHLYAAYTKTGFFEISGGTIRNNIQLRAGFTNFNQKIGLKRNELKSNVAPFVTCQIISFKLSALYRLTEKTKNYPWGFYAGFNLLTMIPVNYAMDTAIAGQLMIHKKIQLNWGMDYIYSLPLGDRGMYVNIAAALTFPGLLGSIGHISMQNGSAYSVVEERMSIYNVRASIGIGFKISGSE